MSVCLSVCLSLTPTKQKHLHTAFTQECSSKFRRNEVSWSFSLVAASLQSFDAVILVTSVARSMWIPEPRFSFEGTSWEIKSRVNQLACLKTSSLPLHWKFLADNWNSTYFDNHTWTLFCSCIATVDLEVTLLTTTTTTTTTIVLRSFVRDFPGEPVPEETFTHPPSWSSSNHDQLLPSTTIHSIFPVQITCLAIFLHNLSPCPLWSISWSGALHLIFHTFLHAISVFFSQHMPIPSQPVKLLHLGYYE